MTILKKEKNYLKDVQKKLDDNFYRCHKSFIVNKSKIKRIDKKSRIIYMINDEQCLVSIRALRSLKEMELLF